jgi:hypothetical protein
LISPGSSARRLDKVKGLGQGRFARGKPDALLGTKPSHLTLRQLSKRQMTWLRAEHCVWLPASEASLAQALDLIEAACR